MVTGTTAHSRVVVPHSIVVVLCGKVLVLHGRMYFECKLHSQVLLRPLLPGELQQEGKPYYKTTLLLRVFVT